MSLGEYYRLPPDEQWAWLAYWRLWREDRAKERAEEMAAFLKSLARMFKGKG